MMHSHATLTRASYCIEGVLILVVMDDALARCLCRRYDKGRAVLILVVMDDALALVSDFVAACKRSLNPCCNG